MLAWTPYSLKRSLDTTPCLNLWLITPRMYRELLLEKLSCLKNLKKLRHHFTITKSHFLGDLTLVSLVWNHLRVGLSTWTNVAHSCKVGSTKELPLLSGFPDSSSLKPSSLPHFRTMPVKCKLLLTSCRSSTRFTMRLSTTKSQRSLKMVHSAMECSSKEPVGTQSLIALTSPNPRCCTPQRPWCYSCPVVIGRNQPPESTTALCTRYSLEQVLFPPQVTQPTSVFGWNSPVVKTQTNGWELVWPFSLPYCTELDYEVYRRLSWNISKGGLH